MFNSLRKIFPKRQSYPGLNIGNIGREISSQPASESLPPKEEATSDDKNSDVRKTIVPPRFRFIYPEFLPDPKIEWRNAIREKLERHDMLKRRTQIDIPEFYVGTIMSVTSANKHSSPKHTKFVGICIDRTGCGLRAQFVLRNVVDGLGTEICFSLYDPKIIKIEVLRLEKHVDKELYYLRDAPPEHSTFDFDLEPVILPQNAPIPINATKVKLKPRPWVKRWERTKFQGIDRDHIMTLISDKMKWQLTKHETPWEKYDLMKQYRATIPEEEQQQIFSEVYSELHGIEHDKKKMKRKRSFIKPVKSG